MTGLLSLAPELQQRLKAEAAGAPILWAGQSQPALVFRSTLVVLLVGVPIVVFATLWSLAAFGKLFSMAFAEPIAVPSPWFAILFGMLAMGCGVLICLVPWYSNRAAFRTAYALTETAMIEVQLGIPRFVGREAEHYDLAKITKIWRKDRDHGRGDFRIDFSSRRHAAQEDTDVIHLLGIADVDSLAWHIARLRKA